MKKISLSSILFCLLFSLYSCKNNPKVEEEHYYGKIAMVTSPNNMLACYCLNGGYITSDQTGEITPLCFDGVDHSNPCEAYGITGYKKTVESIIRNSDNCPGGPLTFVQVVKYRCLEQ